MGSVGPCVARSDIGPWPMKKVLSDGMIDRPTTTNNKHKIYVSSIKTV